MDDSGDVLGVSITQCRALTRGGLLVDVRPGAPVRASINKRTLDGVSDVGVYIVTAPHDKEPDDSWKDPVNPSIPVGRRAHYTVALDVRADEVDRSVLVTRLERAPTSPRFQRRATASTKTCRRC